MTIPAISRAEFLAYASRGDDEPGAKALVMTRVLHLFRETYPDAIGAIVFECHVMDSSQRGEVQIFSVGPSNTIKTVEECEGKFTGDVPSRMMSPVGWIPREELLKET